MEFNHTVQQGLEAMQNLIYETGLQAGDFYIADKDHEEIGYPEGTPMIVTSDDSCISAYDHYVEWEFNNDEEQQDAYVDFMMDKMEDSNES